MSNINTISGLMCKSHLKLGIPSHRKVPQEESLYQGTEHSGLTGLLTVQFLPKTPSTERRLSQESLAENEK